VVANRGAKGEAVSGVSYAALTVAVVAFAGLDYRLFEQQ
jgi:hypothetical protein